MHVETNKNSKLNIVLNAYYQWKFYYI